MWPIFVNIFTLSIACILVFILRILPAKTNTRNAYLILLLIALIIHLLAELMYLMELVNVRVFSVIVVGMVILYGPALYYYTRKFYGLSTRFFLLQIVPLELGMLIIFYFNEWPQWVISSYYAGIELFYFLATISLKSIVKLKKSQYWLKILGNGFGILVLLHIAEAIWINVDPPSALNSIRISTAIQNIFSFLFLLFAIKQIIVNPESFSNLKIK